ncbi:hypothetical protein [Vreelandella sp. V005]|uniref:hypothetical protein n=1 Tax=Vreelandella sp. V005 TaxID=3459608 RepID=UPI0040444502
MHHLTEILAQASAAIPSLYFQLPVDGQEDPIYRERVYCYELYHQLRSIWPENCGYSLGGEVDKAGHRLIRGNDLDNTKPDFLVHVPGDMGGNHAVIEVKPAHAANNAIRADIETLRRFRDYAGYERAIFYIYGSSENGNAKQRATDFLAELPGTEVEVWVHEEAKSRAKRVV